MLSYPSAANRDDIASKHRAVIATVILDGRPPANLTAARRAPTRVLPPAGSGPRRASPSSLAPKAADTDALWYPSPSLGDALNRAEKPGLREARPEGSQEPIRDRLRYRQPPSRPQKSAAKRRNWTVLYNGVSALTVCGCGGGEGDGALPAAGTTVLQGGAAASGRTPRLRRWRGGRGRRASLYCRPGSPCRSSSWRGRCRWCG